MPKIQTKIFWIREKKNLSILIKKSKIFDRREKIFDFLIKIDKFFFSRIQKILVWIFGIGFWFEFWFEFLASESNFGDFGWNFEFRNWILVSLCSIFVILIFKFGFGNQLLHCARILSRDPKIWIQRHRFALQLSWRPKLNPKIKNQNLVLKP